MLCIINVMQKIVNVLAIASSVVSLAVVGGGIYVYTQKDAIIEDIKQKAIGSIGLGTGGFSGATSPLRDLAPDLGVPDLSPTAPQSSPGMMPDIGLGQ